MSKLKRTDELPAVNYWIRVDQSHQGGQAGPFPYISTSIRHRSKVQEADRILLDAFAKMLRLQSFDSVNWSTEHQLAWSKRYSIEPGLAEAEAFEIVERFAAGLTEPGAEFEGCRVVAMSPEERVTHQF